IGRIGANSVSLVVHWSQRDVRSVELAPEPRETASDAGVEEVVAEAKRLGLEVLLFPIVQVRERAGKDWRGTIRPADWAAWFAAYEGFVLHYARIAARHGLARLSVGTELLSAEGERASWARL